MELKKSLKKAGDFDGFKKFMQRLVKGEHIEQPEAFPEKRTLNVGFGCEDSFPLPQKVNRKRFPN